MFIVIYTRTFYKIVVLNVHVFSLYSTLKKRTSKSFDRARQLEKEFGWDMGASDATVRSLRFIANPVQVCIFLNKNFQPVLI